MKDSNPSSKQLAAIYARVACADSEGKEIQNQVSGLEQLAHERGYTIVKKYIEGAWSGMDIARPQLDALRDDARKGLWDVVLVRDPDRLARRYSYQELVIDELQKLGKEVIFPTIPTPQNPEDKILHEMRGLFAEYERVKTAERFRLGKLRAQKTRKRKMKSHNIIKD